MSVEYHNHMPKRQLLVATTNQGKIREIRELLRTAYLEILSLSDFPELNFVQVHETGNTFAENAQIKAREYGRLAGIVTLADDSGLSVDALEGRPGVQSKRYGHSDPERIEKLLKELNNVPRTNRQAHFTCVMALYDPSSDKTYLAEGKVNGLIADRPTGSYGFGYDPVFYVPELEKTFGEVPASVKNQISHRFQALRGIEKIIRKHFS
jgi:XTP/dITP diphosphohydrolase